ncbi:kinase-like protein [Xylaria sp. FL0043]|nr:kinase-like protein [Xylaria sp. FL0043]
MVSTIVGESGRVYVHSEILRHNPHDFGFTSSIFKAESENKSFILRRPHTFFYKSSLLRADEFRGSRRLRMHIDCNHEEDLLIYPYYKSTLLSLIQNNSDLPWLQRRKILRHVAEAIKELHSKNWIHTDIRPDNVFLDWTCDNEGIVTVTNVALGDSDIACQFDDGETCDSPCALGDVTWRSPEAQTRTGVSKALDIFSFGLVCIYTLGRGPFLFLNVDETLGKDGITPEQAILIRHFSYFVPIPEGLLARISNEMSRRALKWVSRAAEQRVKDNPALIFTKWGAVLGPEAQDMISGMTNVDPRARPTIDQVLGHR